MYIFTFKLPLYLECFDSALRAFISTVSKIATRILAGLHLEK
jgi:hypothetical protein